MTAAAERKAQREKAFLEKLEELRRNKTPSWPDHFAREILGFKSKKALDGYPLTKKAIQLYGLKTAPHKMRGYLPAAKTEIAVSVGVADVTRLRAENEDLSAKIARLERSVAVTEEALMADRAAHEETKRSLAIARAMVDELDHYVAHRSVPLAQDVEEMLHRAAARITGEPVREVAPTVTPSRPEGTGLKLVRVEDDPKPPRGGRRKGGKR